MPKNCNQLLCELLITSEMYKNGYMALHVKYVGNVHVNAEWY